MAREIILPKLGMDMDRGSITEWFAEEGAPVKKGDPLFEVLTDKMNIEVQAESTGVLLKKTGKIHEEYPIFTVVGYLGDEGEVLPEEASLSEAETENQPKVKKKPAEVGQNPSKLPSNMIKTEADKNQEGYQGQSLEEFFLERRNDLGVGKIRATPAARRLAKEHHIVLENLVGTGPGGRIKIEDIEALTVGSMKASTPGEPEPVVINTELEEILGNFENTSLIPTQKESLAQRVPALAKIMSMVDDLDLIPRSDTRGPDGRVVSGEPGSIKRFQEEEKEKEDDEEDFSADYGEYVKVLPRRTDESMEDDPRGSSDKKESTDKDILSGKRKIIADRMVKSNLENAVITLTIEIDMTEVKALRKKIAKKIEDQTRFRCTFTDFLLMSVSRALIKHPEINASLIGREIIKHHCVHIGLAVGTEDGLVVPVIRNAQEMDFAGIVKNRAEILKAVKNKYISQEDLKGSTFTITNLGMYGVLEFTAIINQPNSAILSVGEVVHRMRLYQGEPMMRSVMKVSLNLDHRVADGMTGAKFLQDLKSDMENPSLLLF